MTDDILSYITIIHTIFSDVFGYTLLNPRFTELVMKSVFPGIFICALLLAGCSEDKPESTQMSEDNVFKPQVDSLQKAKTVEDTIQSSFDQRGQQVQ